MAVIGCIIGIIDILIGVFALITAPQIWYIGVSTLLSGIIFIYICIGASTAFSSEKRIEKLESKINSQGAMIKYLAEKANVNLDEISVLWAPEKPTKLTINLSELEIGTQLKLKRSRLVAIDDRPVELPQGSVGEVIMIEKKTLKLRFDVNGKKYVFSFPASDMSY